jgi:hypothetical protein
MVMTGETSDLGWAIKVHAGDELRLQGVYDSTIASWYEQMGIVMTWLAPPDNGGVDPFDPAVHEDEGLNVNAVYPPTEPGVTLPGGTTYQVDANGNWVWDKTCVPSATTLCVRGQATHARLAANGDHWTCVPVCYDTPGTAPDGQVTNTIHMAGFTYGQADFGVIGTAGIPLVHVNTPVQFVNEDSAAYVWHTVTRCAQPCSGSTSASYPTPNGAWSDLVSWNDPSAPADTTARTQWMEDQTTSLVQNGVVACANGALPVNNACADNSTPALMHNDPLDFDSGQVGNQENAGVSTATSSGSGFYTSWSWTPTRTGIYTFFCRIHPFMRGAIKVIP